MITEKIFILLLLYCGMGVSQQMTLVEFELEDQFGRKYSRADFEGRVILMVGSDKDGSPFNEIWSVAIHDSLEQHQMHESVVFLPVADVRGVPFFMKGFVKNQFSKDKERGILLDWKGIFAGSYQFESKMSNILIFDSDGNLIYRCAGREIDQSKLETCLDNLYSILGVK